MISVELKNSLQKGQRNLEIRASRLPDIIELSYVYPYVANVGGLQIQGVEGEVVVLYFEPLTTQNLRPSGVPEG
jgi:hypothetical protein